MHRDHLRAAALATNIPPRPCSRQHSQLGGPTPLSSRAYEQVIVHERESRVRVQAALSTITPLPDGRLPAARCPATDEELARVPEPWRAVFQRAGSTQCDRPRKLRSPQTWLLEAVASGHDVAGIVATGAGKSHAWLVPCAAGA